MAESKFEPDVVGALRHLCAAVRAMGLASPSGHVHPSVALAEAAITDPAIEEARQAAVDKAMADAAQARADERAKLAAQFAQDHSLEPPPPEPKLTPAKVATK